ncbi:uncharacterized protein LOC100175494 isoform X2 [Ciona intestinalis]
MVVMTDTENQRPFTRRLSSGNLNGLSQTGLRRKKNSLAFLNVFQKKSESEHERRSSSSGLLDFIRRKRLNSSSSSDFDTSGLLSPHWGYPECNQDFKPPKKKNNFHTWSLRRNPPPNISELQEPVNDVNENISSKISNGFATMTLGRRTRARRAKLTNLAFEQANLSDPVERRAADTRQPSFVGLFSSETDNSEFIEINCDQNNHRDSVESSDNDHMSVGSGEGKQKSALSRNPSIASRISSNPMPPSPNRPPYSPAKDSPRFFRRISSTLSPHGRRKSRRAREIAERDELIKARQETLTSSNSDEDNVDSPLSDDNNEDVFTNWDHHQHASTLPRTKKETYESTDAIKENNTSKNKSNKRPSIIQRPQSMMLNRPSQYSVGNPPTANYAQQPGRSRPISTIGGPHSRRNTGSNSSDLTVPKDRSGSNRSSYYDDDEGSRTPPNVSYMNNMKDVISASFESLDEAALDTAELENDPDLALKTDEPEAWSVTVDKKTLKKMSKKDVKRQDNIFEFIQTERNYLTTLKIMQKIFARGLVKEAHIDPEVVEKMFPSIDEHVDYVANFVAKLSDRQAEGKVVDGIGDICVAQWSDTSGNNMKRVFGDFCCKQNEIVATHKELYKTDKKFSAFIKKCDKNPLTRRQGIPECALLVTQRVTKYPIMLQTLLENSNKKDHREDYAELERALDLSREIAKDVDEQVQAHEREQLLYEIYEKTDTKTTTPFKEGRKFARKDLLKRNRKLLYSSNAVQWKISNSKKFTETFFLLLSDCFVLLQENNGKYTFPSGQPAAVPLMRLIVREVANDEKGLYLISTANSQMYELKVDKADDCKTIMQVVRSAVGNCTEEDEGIPSEDEEERKLQEQKLDKARRMIDLLEQKDDAINRLLKQKMEVFRSLAESVERGTAISHMSFSYPTYFLSTEDESSNNNKLTLPPGTPVLLKAIEQVRKMSHAFCGSGGLSRQPSSVGEHESGSRSPSILPKRSDTFGGFDNGKEPSSPRGKWMNNSQSEGKLIEQNNQTTMTSESKRDSGLVDSDVLVRRVDSQGSIHKEAWGINEPSGSPTPSPTASTSGDSYIPPTSDQILTISNLSHLLHSYMSISTQQDTHMEKLQQQLLLVQDKNSKKRGGNLQEVELKRNHIKQQEQLDDLRKQQHQLKIERDQWHRTNERFQKSMAAEKQELEAEKAKIHQEKLENERQRDEIHRAKEDYQREMARLRDLQRRSHHDIHISSSTSSLPTSTVNRNNSNNGADVADLRLSSGDGKTLSSSKSHSSLHSSSDVGTKGPPSPTYTSAADYPRTFPGSKRDSGSAPAPSTSQLPLHLQYSATNQLSALQAPRHQEFPSKLSKLASSTKGKPMTSSGESKSGLMHQMIPSKLTKLASGQSGQHVSSKRLHIV